MMEDKLDRDQRIRLEALAQAINACGHGRQFMDIVEKAKTFESYIEGADNRAHAAEEATRGVMKARAILEAEGYTREQAVDMVNLLKNKGIRFFHSE